MLYCTKWRQEEAVILRAKLLGDFFALHIFIGKRIITSTFENGSTQDIFSFKWLDSKNIAQMVMNFKIDISYHIVNAIDSLLFKNLHMKKN